MDRAIRAGATRRSVSRRVQGEAGDAGAAPVADAGLEEGRPEKFWRSTLVVLLLAVVAIRLHEVFPALSVLRPALVLGLGGVAALWFSAPQRLRAAAASDPSVRWVLIYAIWAGITVPFALYPGQAASMHRAFLPAILLVVALLLLVPSERTIVRVLTGFVVAAGAYAIALLTLGIPIGDGRTELRGGSLDSNDLALVMAMTFPIALGLATRASHGRRIFCLGAAGVLLVAATATGSRGGTIAMIIGSLVFVLGQRGTRKLVFIGLVLVGGVLAWANSSPAYRQRMIALVQGEKDYNYYAYGGRKQIWARARLYTIQHPVVGVGLGNFPIAEGEHLDLLGMRGKWSNAHNAYLQAFAELGFPGGIIFLGLLGATILRAFRHWRAVPRRGNLPVYHRPELLASVMAYAAGSYFLSTAYFYSFFALVGLIALSDRVSLVRGSGAPTAAPPVRRAARSLPGSQADPILRPAPLVLRRRPG